MNDAANTETKTATPVEKFESKAVDPNGRKRESSVSTEPEGPPKSIIREYFESAVVTVIMAIFGMTFIVQAVKVPTGSMQNTILIGDHLLVNKFVFGSGWRLPVLPQREVRRGDIIVFKYPGDPNNPIGDQRPDNIPFKTNYVKRVIGLAGDRVEVRERTVYVNGQPVPEHQITTRDADDNKSALEIVYEPQRKPGELYDVYYSENKELVSGFDKVVPADSYFVMGDNRNNSADGRYWGFVPRDLVIGRAMFVYWSYDESKDFDSPDDFFTNSRWRRTFTMVK